MGTRGIYGFKKGEDYKVTYCHFDSYPSGLGVKVKDFCRRNTIKELEEVFNNIELIKEGSIPSAEQIEECKQYVDIGVASGKITDWYCLLRRAQGNLWVYSSKESNKPIKWMLDYLEGAKDEHCVDYIYLIDIDKSRLEIYSNILKEDHLMKSYPLDNLPDDDTFCEEIHSYYGEEE